MRHVARLVFIVFTVLRFGLDELARVGRTLAGGLRDAVAALGSLAARARGEPRPEPPAR